MGQLSSRHKRSQSVKIVSKLNEIIICPFCSKRFDTNNNYNELNNHLKGCGNTYLENKENDEIYSPDEDKVLNQLIFRDIDKYKNNIYFSEEKNIDFESKINSLHNEINKKKISWVEGASIIEINRSNFLEESINQTQNVNIYKEWKISFRGETNYDAGGIMREWYTTLFKALERDNLKLFIKSETDDYSYIINPFLKRNNKNFKYFDFIGKLMAKALIDNITVNICFNKLIYKMILQESIEFNELVFINKPVYDSIRNLKNTETNSGIPYTELCLYYNLEIKDTNDKVHTLDIINLGREIPVEDIDDYINKRIDFIIGLYEPFIKRIRDSLYNVISKKVIQNFTSDQLELLLNGRPFIDIEDWKQFCEYREPYNSRHYIIIWFWEILSELSQKELSNLLMFSTGSSRVPLGGFASLESNRGSKAKFTIESISYKPKSKNYIKAHTCFNRLDIPLFNDKNELKEAILFVCKNEILGFGID